MASNREILKIGHDIVLKVWAQRKLFYWGTPITFVLSCALILCVPRQYDSEVILAPEPDNSSMGGLSSLAASFGFSIGGASKDAYYPTLYPDIVESTPFGMALLEMDIRTCDGETMSYNDFLEQTPRPFWAYPTKWLGDLMKLLRRQNTISLPDENNTLITMDRDTYLKLKDLRNSISCSVDLKTDVISISVRTQDPLVSALVADSTRVRLQRFITDYRTSKYKNDVAYYGQMMAESQNNYEKCRREYSRYADANGNLMRMSEQVELNRIESEMAMAQEVYEAFQKQYMASLAKMQEHTPSFSIIEPAAVPVKPSKPKRMVFVLIMTLLSMLGTGCWILRDEIIEWF